MTVLSEDFALFVCIWYRMPDKISACSIHRCFADCRTQKKIDASFCIFRSAGGRPAVDIYDWYYMNITSTTSHETRAYTQIGVSCKTNCPINLSAINCLPIFLNTIRFDFEETADYARRSS